MNNMFEALRGESSYDNESSSDNEICLEITECINGVKTTSIQNLNECYIPHHHKRLLCNTVLLHTKCKYNATCKYAHSLSEQVIDYERELLCKIILDKNLFDYNKSTTSKTNEIYTNLKHFTTMCEYCQLGKCTGGFNCKYGANDSSLKLCKNDLYTGECLNKIILLNIPNFILNKIKDIEPSDVYKGCINGHHLSDRGMIPYCKHELIYESSKKNHYSSIRYIDLNIAYNISNDNTSDEDTTSSDSDLDENFKKLNV